MSAGNFPQCWRALIGNEGGYVDTPNDPGGATKWGVTQAVARAHGYTGAMQDLPQATAESIARAEYWDPIQGEELPAVLDFQVLDGAYNSGVGQSAKWLQSNCGVPEDGSIGPETLRVVRAAVARGDLYSLICDYNATRLKFLASLDLWPTFGRGWANRIAHNLALAAQGGP